MPLVVYNSASRKKEVFTPLHDNVVNAYVCGITAYDYCHIGHARSAVVFDAIVRTLRHLGFQVRYIRNFTDVDDKIIQRADRENSTCREISLKFIEEFRKDMHALGVLDPDAEPLATEYVPTMVETIRRLEEKGFAYEVGGTVYFAVDSFPGYGKLSGRDTEEMIAGARVEVDEHKRNPLDFALWKAAKPGEPHWSSPWGEGRPGWHIECSVMSTTILGDTLDIHGGGKDLIFPHHENEVAQAEAATGKPFVRYWLHNGFVNINKEKMSKSLGNFVMIRELLERYHPETLRLFLLSKHYRSPLDFTDENMADAQAGLERIYGALQRVEEACDTAGDDSTGEADLSEAASELIERTESLEARFMEAMQDDFNTAKAVGFLFDMTRAMNRLLDSVPLPLPFREASVLRKSAEETLRMAAILGLLLTGWRTFFRFRTDQALKEKGLSGEEIERLIIERTEARKTKNWARADEIRDYLKDRGILLKDSAEGTSWGVA